MEMKRKHIDARTSPVLFISDQHHPYQHPDTIPFLKLLKSHVKPGFVINLGDEIDHHMISFHTSNPELPFSPSSELEAAIEDIQRLYKLFPDSLLVHSNHGSLAFRKIKEAGLPITMLKPLSEIYGTPKWTWHEEIIIRTMNGEVLVAHGDGKKAGRLATTKEEGVSVVMGHHHSIAEITYIKSVHNLKFQMICGCLVDQYSMSMSYGKKYSKKPVICTGALDIDGFPELYPMKLDRHGRWIGTL